jgi:tRNA A37 methylthiotransferase MiaB
MFHLSREMSEQYMEGFLQRKVMVLLEQKSNANPIATGYTEHYLPCEVNHPDGIPHQGLLLATEIQRIKSGKLIGKNKM